MLDKCTQKKRSSKGYLDCVRVLAVSVTTATNNRQFRRAGPMDELVITGHRTGLDSNVYESDAWYATDTCQIGHGR